MYAYQHVVAVVYIYYKNQYYYYYRCGFLVIECARFNNVTQCQTSKNARKLGGR